jgi:hypothetical protein
MLNFCRTYLLLNPFTGAPFGMLLVSKSIRTNPTFLLRKPTIQPQRISNEPVQYYIYVKYC